MRRQTTLVCLLAVAFLFPAAARAEHTRYWRQSDFPQFEKGTAKGVAVRSDGKLAPAPKFTAFADPNMAYLWALRLNSRGQLYAAGGSDAKVVRFDNDGKGTTVFESSELSAQAIAFDAKDNLYVGTSPDGKVYKITPEGQKSVFFDPKTKYIWALAMDTQGDLFVATGDKGEVFVVSADGKGRLFYRGDERHARCLAFDSKGNLLIGTDPDGLIVRVEIARKKSQALPEADASFVIYETDKSEVTSLLLDGRGNLYAAAVGAKSLAPRIVPANPPLVVGQQQPQVAATSQGIIIAQTAAIAPQRVVPFPIFPSAPGGADVVKILPDGSPEAVWESRDDLVFATSLAPSGKLLLGTGDKGAIIEPEGGRVYSNVAQTASAQVTGFATGQKGEVFVATANPGKIFTLGPGYEAGGSFESDTLDAKIFSHWGRLTWWGEDGATQGKVAFYVRSGNTSNPGDNWSQWAGPYKSPGSETVSCPPARFAQWKAVFLDTDHGAAPDISWVSLAYQPQNVAPVIDAIAIQTPGIRAQGFVTQQGGPQSALPVQLRMPQRADGVFLEPPVDVEISAKRASMEIPPQGFQEKGYQTVLWSAHDDNDDDLIFSIYYRGENEKNWRLLKDKIREMYYSWDTATMPDGAYYLKIVASDSPSNPPDQAITAEMESDRLRIANTPPKIENLRADTSPSAAKVSFDGADTSGAIERARYSLDAKDWKILFPMGMLSDAPRESYEVRLSGLAAGEHTMAVEIFDRFGNTAAAKITFTIAESAAR